jgi:hypothetical protein
MEDKEKMKETLTSSPALRAVLEDELKKSGVETTQPKWWQFWK